MTTSSLLKDFATFLQTSPTAWHCVQEVISRLNKKGFSALEEQELWHLREGHKYFVSRGGSMAAFCLPSNRPHKILLLVAHTDSPGLKIKPHPVITQHDMNLLEVEVYGSPILHSWLNRDLALAGRCFLRHPGGEVHEELVFLDTLPLMIPELAIHLDRDVNTRGPFINKQEHLMPLLSMQMPLTLDSLLRKSFSFETLLSFDLFLTPLESPRFLGLQKEWIASYRLDNLTSVHAAMTAIMHYEDSPTLPIIVFLDHEEIGSKSWEGACSSFIHDLLCRLRGFYSFTEEEFLVMKRNSLCLSLDMAHGLNPMHAGKHDPNHKPLLGKGLVLKHSAELKYASSAYTLAKAIQIGERALVPLQHFVSRSDIPSGSTVGPHITASLGIPTVDLGCAQLSMHSAREMMATSDYLDCVTFLQEALRSS
ncbi:MAG: M18 family aminopeptidase [Chlamydiae bacterium]|nr:M18 family aminopeptidase [Chlamydiota bacterium]